MSEDIILAALLGFVLWAVSDEAPHMYTTRERVVRLIATIVAVWFVVQLAHGAGFTWSDIPPGYNEPHM